MRYYFIAAIFFMTAFSVITHAATPKKSLPEKKGVESINRATAEAHIGFLASDQLQGREASENGGSCSLNTFSTSCFRSAIFSFGTAIGRFCHGQ